MKVACCLFLLVVALGSGLCPGCVNTRKFNEELGALLRAERQMRNVASAELRNGVEEALALIETHKTRLENLEELGTAEQKLRLKVATLSVWVDEFEGRRLGIPRPGTVKDFVSAEDKALEKSLRDDLEAADEKLDVDVIAAVDRIEELEEAKETASTARDTLREKLESDLDETRSELEKTIKGLRSDIVNKKTLKEPVDKILAEWKRDENIVDRKSQSDAIENQTRYVLPGILVIVAALLGNAGLALRPRYRKEIDDALRTAETANNAAQAAVAVSAGARESVEAALADLSLPRKHKPRETQEKEQKPANGIPRNTEEGNKGG